MPSKRGPPQRGRLNGWRRTQGVRSVTTLMVEARTARLRHTNVTLHLAAAVLGQCTFPLWRLALPASSCLPLTSAKESFTYYSLQRRSSAPA